LAKNPTADEYKLEFADLPYASAYIVTVVSKDGFAEVESVSQTFQLGE